MCILYLKAAWSFDDYREKDNAIYARKMAIEYFDKYLLLNDKIDLRIIKIDLLRRTNDFDSAISQAKKLFKKVNNDFLKKILIFEIQLSKLKDSLCHTVGEV